MLSEQNSGPARCMRKCKMLRCLQGRVFVVQVGYSPSELICALILLALPLPPPWTHHLADPAYAYAALHNRRPTASCFIVRAHHLCRPHARVPLSLHNVAIRMRHCQQHAAHSCAAWIWSQRGRHTKREGGPRIPGCPSRRVQGPHTHRRSTAAWPMV